MKNILKVIVALGVFTMTIGSSFAMDTNPPTEPVKTTVEMEVVTEDIQPTVIYYGYKISLNQCVYVGTLDPLSSDCLPTNSGLICVDDLDRELYQMHFDEDTNTWICDLPLNKPEVN